MPAIAGFLIPLSLFLAIVHFSDDTLSAVVGTLLTIGIILTLGETTKTFGSYSFARIFQGKAILLSLGIPLFTAFSINYFSKPSWINWMGLFIVSTGCIGLSSTTIFIIPALSSVLLLANLFSAKQYKFPMIISYFASLTYIVLVAFYVFFYWKAGFENLSPANQGLDASFSGRVNLFINPRAPLTPLLLIASTILVFFVLRGMRRNFLLIWAFASIVMFLNPFTSPLIIEHITTANAYWRMFYIYPFPLIVGVILATLFDKTSHLSPSKRFFIVIVTSVILIGIILQSPTSVTFNESDRWLKFQVTTPITTSRTNY